MESETTKQFKTSIFPNDEIQHVKKSQLKMSSWYGVVPILLISFFILKGFIYIKDEKRHGK